MRPVDEKCPLDPQRDCLGLIKAGEREGDLEEEFGELRRQSSNSHERVFDQIHTLEKGDLARSPQYDNIMSARKSLAGSMDLRSKRLSEIVRRPARRWEDTVKQILGIAVAALRALLLGKFGL